MFYNQVPDYVRHLLLSNYMRKHSPLKRADFKALRQSFCYAYRRKPTDVLQHVYDLVPYVVSDTYLSRLPRPDRPDAGRILSYVVCALSWTKNGGPNALATELLSASPDRLPQVLFDVFAVHGCDIVEMRALARLEIYVSMRVSDSPTNAVKR